VGIVLAQRSKHVVVNLILASHLSVEVAVAHVKDAPSTGGSLGHSSDVLQPCDLSSAQLTVGVDRLLLARSGVLRVLRRGQQLQDSPSLVIEPDCNRWGCQLALVLLELRLVL
jgi:hypothetical protein